MAKKKLLILAIVLSLTVSTLGMLPLVGCTKNSDQQAVLSAKDGDVFVMKAGTNSWTEAQLSLILEEGDAINAHGAGKREGYERAREIAEGVSCHFMLSLYKMASKIGVVTLWICEEATEGM